MIFLQIQTFRTYNGHNFPLNLCNFVYSIFLQIQTLCTYNVHNFSLNLRYSGHSIFSTTRICWNPNFDPAIRIGWNQCHCKDYQILIPKTIYGSKSELERPRYHENWVNALINASLTFGSHNFWSDHWIFKFHTMLETRSQDNSRGVKINLIQGHLKMASLEGPSPRKACRGYKRPWAPPKPEKIIFLGLDLFLDIIHTFFLSLKHKKHIKASWFFIFHQKYKLLFLYPIFFSLVLHLRFRVLVCGCSFLATIHTPNFLNLFLAFVLLFYALGCVWLDVNRIPSVKWM